LGLSSECFEHGNLKEKEVEEKQGNLREMPRSLRRGTGRESNVGISITWTSKGHSPI
jgi:hypothetical protein